MITAYVALADIVGQKWCQTRLSADNNPSAVRGRFLSNTVICLVIFNNHGWGFRADDHWPRLFH